VSPARRKKKRRRRVKRQRETLRNFRAWYVKVLESLYPRRASGVATLMISFPLLERYLRQANGLKPEEVVLNDSCMTTLQTIFAALPDIATARNFWQVYRNGLLHQATLSTRTRKGTILPAGSMTHDIKVPLVIKRNGSFVLHPVFFSQEVVRTIEANFRIFEGVGTPGPRLLRAEWEALSAGLGPQTFVLSTK
jgi:hypothetical protein